MISKEMAHVRRLLVLVGSEPRVALSRVVALMRASWLLRSCERDDRIYAFGGVRVANSGRIVLGEGVTFLRGMIPAELSCDRGARLEIGPKAVLNYGISIESHASITIGSHFLGGSFVRLCDRGPGGTAPICIGNDVWIAHGAIIEPGVTIGDGSVVSAGSVVTKDVPTGCLASGNPARVMSLSLLDGESAAVAAEPSDLHARVAR